jgi:tRNA(Leu) C34 or U34 (ribose-2'-O)-methylase TrmL
MPGAGTDKTKRWFQTPAPIVVLVEPQLGENIGAAARAMANFGLSRLRLVKPLQGWPNEKARVMAAGADRILDGVALYDNLNHGAQSRSGEAGRIRRSGRVRNRDTGQGRGERCDHLRSRAYRTREP